MGEVNLLEFKEYLNDFCNKFGYTNKVEFDKTKNECSIIISNGIENAGVWLTKDELRQLNNDELKKTIEMLHNGIQIRMKTRH